MSRPTFSVNEWTTPGLPFVDELEAYREAGADAIGLVDILGKFREVPDALERFRASGLKAGLCIPDTVSVLPRPDLAHHIPGADDPDARVEQIIESIRRLAPYEPLLCIGVPGPQTTYEPQEARAIAVAGLKRVARAAADLGVTIGLEPLHASMGIFTFLHTLPDAAAMLDEIDEPNTGLVFDTWHHWDNPDVLADIRAHGHRIIGVHINDYRDPTRSWCDRVLPGDGLMDLPGLLGALRDAGYDGWFELEVLSDDGRNKDDFPDSLWRADPVELIRTGRERVMALWDAAQASH